MLTAIRRWLSSCLLAVVHRLDGTAVEMIEGYSLFNAERVADGEILVLATMNNGLIRVVLTPGMALRLSRDLGNAGRDAMETLPASEEGDF
jgi:hypothetical protein